MYRMRRGWVTLLGALLIVASCFGAVAEECVDRLLWGVEHATQTVNGKPLVLKGVSYFGFETETFAPHGLWSYSLDFFLDFIKKNNFNAIRVPFSLELVKKNPGNLNINCAANPQICKMNALELLDAFIDRAADRGLLIMLDNHRQKHDGGISPLWYDNEYPESDLMDVWNKLVDRVQNKWNVFALDLKNEPHDQATWSYSNWATDWNQAAERIMRALKRFPGYFYVEGIEWGNRLENVKQFPINTGDDSLSKRVVYSPHCYGPSVFDRPVFHDPNFPNNLQNYYMDLYGFIPKLTGQPVSVGEWGGRAQPGTPDGIWNEWYVGFLRENCLTNTFYWCLNPNSGDTGGLLEDDWQTPNLGKLELVAKAQPTPTKFAVQNGKICITHGTFPESKCHAGFGGNGTDGTVGSHLVRRHQKWELSVDAKKEQLQDVYISVLLGLKLHGGYPKSVSPEDDF